MSATTWTVFWRNLGIKTVNRPRAIKNNNPKKDFASLQRIGIDRNIAENIYQRSNAYGDELFFSKFSRFFRKDPQTIKLWIKGKSITDAFRKLFNIIKPNDLDNSKDRFNELDLIFKLYNKGERRHYEAAYSKSIGLKFDPKSLIFNLNLHGGDAKYKKYGFTKLGTDIIFCIQKTTQIGQPVFKFIKLSKERKKLKIALSMDTTKEYNIAKKSIEKWFAVFFDTTQSSKSLKKIEDFLIEGESKNFILTGVTYFDNEFKLNVSDLYNRPVK